MEQFTTVIQSPNFRISQLEPINRELGGTTVLVYQTNSLLLTFFHFEALKNYTAFPIDPFSEVIGFRQFALSYISCDEFLKGFLSAGIEMRAFFKTFTEFLEALRCRLGDRQTITRKTQDQSSVRSTFVAQPFVAKGLVVVNFKLFENRLKTILAGKLLCIHSCLQKNLCFRDIFERYTYVLTSTMILMIKNKSYKVT